MCPVNGSPSHVSRVNSTIARRGRALTSKLVPPVSHDDRRRRAGVSAARRRAGDGRHRRARVDRVDRPRGDVVDVAARRRAR